MIQWQGPGPEAVGEDTQHSGTGTREEGGLHRREEAWERGVTQRETACDTGSGTWRRTRGLVSFVAISLQKRRRPRVDRGGDLGSSHPRLGSRQSRGGL